MTSLVTIKKEVDKIKEKVALKHRDDLVIIFSFGPDDEPHGKYGFRKLHVFEEHQQNGKYEACSEEDELRMMRERYADMADEVKKNTPYWSTWEKFLEYHRCKCPLHSQESKQ